MLFLSTLNIETIVLMLSALIGCAFLISWHFDKNNHLTITTLITNPSDGKLSLSRLGQFIAMLVSTWVVIYQTRHNQLTEWLFTGYMLAWAGANFAQTWLKKDKPKEDK